MAFVYWSANYWNANYWQADYWQEIANDNATTDYVYWSGNYWVAGYWQPEYWQASPNENTLSLAVESLTLNALAPAIGRDIVAEPGLEALTLSAISPSINSETATSPGAQDLTLTALGPQVAVDLWDYFSDDYFAPNYWNANYWSEDNVATGGGTNVNASVETLALNEFPTVSGLDQVVLPATEGLTFTALATDTANDVTATNTLETLSLASFNPNVDNAGYVLADIDLSVFVSSAFSFTDGVNVSLEALTLSAQSPVGVDYDTNVTVNVGSTPDLTLTDFPVTATNPKVVLPTTLSLSLTEYSTDAGLGQLANANIESLTLNGIQANVLATNVDVGFVVVERPGLTLNAINPDVDGVRRLPTKPPSTFVIDQIINATATTNVPSNYLICDRSGFRVKVSEGLREEWDGTMVRAKSYEARHPQDFVRSRPSSLTGSKRPEQEDEFISDRFPAGVTADDL